MRRLLAVLALLTLVAAACGTAAADGPPDVKYGRDICVQCNMIISEVGHAAAYRLDNGLEKKFDGIGEMIVHARTHDELDRVDAWVHDYRTEEWVRAEVAFYVPTLAVSSPMGHGIFGFADETTATDFAAQVGGEVIDWATVLRLPITDGLLRHGGDAEGTEDGHQDHGDDMDGTEAEG